MNRQYLKLMGLLLLGTVMLNSCDQASQPENTADNRSNPDVRVKDFKGQWVLINYWARWCKPCLQEIPELNEFDRKFSEASVLGVNFDGAVGDDLAAQIEEFSIEFPVLKEDPAFELGTSRPMVLPTTLVVNPTGELIATLVGPQNVASLAKAIGEDVQLAPD